MRKPKNQHWKLVGLLLIPLILALGIRMIYASTPQYAFKRFMTAVREGDSETAKSLMTPRYFADCQIEDPKDPFSTDRAWEKAIRNVPTVVWQRPDSTHADFSYITATRRETWRYHLLKSKQG